MQEVVDRFLIPHFMRLGMDATGEWRENVQVRAEPNVGYIDGRHYSEQLALGRKPGKRPPIAPLQRWVQAKLHLSGNEAKGVAFAIANKIAKEGTSWYQKGGSDLIEILESREVTEFVNSKVGDYLRVQTEIEIRRTVETTFA